MPYNPGVQDISGQLLSRGMEQAALMRSQAIGNIGTGIANAINVFQKRKEEDEDLQSKAKAASTFLTQFADTFAPIDPNTGKRNPESITKFLEKNIDETDRQYAKRVIAAVPQAIDSAKMQQLQAATELERAKADQAKMDIEEQKKAAEWMKQFGGMGGPSMGVSQVPPSALNFAQDLSQRIPSFAQSPVQQISALPQQAAAPVEPQTAVSQMGNIPASVPSMLAAGPAVGGASGVAPSAVPSGLERFSPAARYPAPSRGPLAGEAPENIKEPTVQDAMFLARQMNMGKTPTGAQTANVLEMLQKRYDTTVKGVGMTERDKAYKILEDAFVQNNEGRKPNAQEKSELLQRAATIGTVGFAQGMPMMNPDGSFAGFTVADKKTGDVKLFVPGKEGLSDVPKGATPSTQGSFTKSILPMPEFQKLKREVTDDEISLDRYSKYLNTVGGARQGIDLLADQVAGKITTLFNNKKLTQEQVNAAMASGQLQALIGASRLNTVGGGVMTEKDAERVILRLGGDVGALQNKEVVARAIADLYAEKYRRYQDSLGFYNSAVNHYYNQQGFTPAKPVEFDPKMIQSGNEMYGLSETEKRLAELRKRKQELEAKAK